MSAAVTIATLLILLFCVFEVVGVATDYWMTVGHISRLVKSHAGLFKICYEVFTIQKCFNYVQYAEKFLNGKNCNFCNCVYWLFYWVWKDVIDLEVERLS
jgi:hypothetical protein